MRSFFVLLALSIPLAGHAQLEEEAYKPEITAEQAAITARRALEKNGFNKDRFEIRTIEYKTEILTDETREEAKKTGAESRVAVIESLTKEFGNGPAWKVTFWRTEKVSDTGNWYDALEFGIFIYVFPGNRAALMDYRVVKDPADLITPDPKPNKSEQIDR